jgi:hypothetical protein
MKALESNSQYLLGIFPSRLHVCCPSVRGCESYQSALLVSTFEDPKLIRLEDLQFYDHNSFGIFICARGRGLQLLIRYMMN